MNALELRDEGWRRAIFLEEKDKMDFVVEIELGWGYWASHEVRLDATVEEEDLEVVQFLFQRLRNFGEVLVKLNRWEKGVALVEFYGTGVVFGEMLKSIGLAK